jgi:SAM-dependent methyltransferase
MNRFNDHIIQHFALRLKSLYTRLTFNPWRRNVVYIGKEFFFPFNFNEKCFMHVTTSAHDELASTSFKVILDDMHLPFDGESIDTIICDLSSVEKKHSTVLLKEAIRVLHPQGKLILTYNNRYSPYYYASSKENPYSSWGIQRLLKEHKLIILKSFYQSFLFKHCSRRMQRWLIKYEPFLRKFIYFFANKITLLIVKETDFYQPLPAYLRLSKKIPVIS